jgi:hypothetical protein
MAFAAGVAEVEITPDPGVELMGYGARIGHATSVHDPLFGRALYLAGAAGPHEAVLIITADLCLMAPAQAKTIREQISERTPLNPAQIVVGCTHTHSGPDTGIAALNAEQDLPPHVPELMQRLVQVGLDAVARARPARFRWCTAEARIGKNRRVWDGPLEPRILILSVQGTDGRPLAVLFHHGCHGTVLGHDNLEISADWPGVAARRIREQLGAPALFLLGAHADIDPRTRGLMDLAIPGQSMGLGFEAVRILGLEVADAVLGALERSGEHAEGPVGAASAELTLPVHLGELGESQARQALDARKRELAQLLDVPLEEFPRLSRLSPQVEKAVADQPLSDARRQIALARLYVRDKTAPFFSAGKRQVGVEAQVLRIGDAALLCLPLEPTTRVGQDWAERAQRQLSLGGVAGIANGWLRYLPHADDLAHPQATEHYEVLQSIVAPGACEQLLDAGDSLLATLMR